MLSQQLCLGVTIALLCFGVSVLSQNCGTSIRRSWRDLSCTEQAQYLRAVQKLKDSGVYDELVRVHWDTFQWAHGVPDFLPWHRYYLWVFERELQRASGSCVTVPYWDWERGDSLPIVLRPSTFGTRNGGGCVQDGIARTWSVAQNGPRCLERGFDERERISRDSELLSRITNNRDFRRFSTALEGTPHIALHEYIAGDMETDWSPDDPLFWIHHANVDRIWTLWQDYRDHDQITDIKLFTFDHFDGNLDRPLRIITGPTVNFYHPSGGRMPTPRELLIPRQGSIVDVQYVNDSLARLLVESSSSYSNGGNNPNWISPSIQHVTERCGRDIDLQGESDGNGNPPATIEPPTEQPSQNSPQVQPRPTCLDRGMQCHSEVECCSNACNPDTGRCSCYRLGSRCQSPNECCSGICGRFGRCARRLLQEKDYNDELLDFSSEPVRTRWQELIQEHPDDPATLWAILAKEDCEARAAEAHDDLNVENMHLINMMNMQNETEVLHCHYVQI